uniref:Uncharacterized protein n=1 Tax=Rhizophora mucronata TaxID=61149 RepID=A0A2P2KCZ9_RHIMU
MTAGRSNSGYHRRRRFPAECN